MKTFLKSLYFLFGMFVGYQFGRYIYGFDFISSMYPASISVDMASFITRIVVGIIFGIIFLIIIPAIARAFDKISQDWVTELKNVPITQLIITAIGFLIAFSLAALLSTPIYKLNIHDVFKVIISIALYVGLGYLSYLLVANRTADIESFFKNAFEKKIDKEDMKEIRTKNKKKTVPIPKVLDTSVIIDGRILDILQTGFIDGPIIIPTFVLDELQYIADSPDGMKRNRGRRGLDILNKIQKELPLEIIVSEKDYPDLAEVDSKLIRLARDYKGKVVTNDYNLNKVSEIHGIDVLNTNDLSNAVKSIVLPGEEINVQIIKEGKENEQGVGYLDDGTMIVVEGGKHLIGKQLNTVVTSVLQTSAGRLIFAKPV